MLPLLSGLGLAQKVTATTLHSIFGREARSFKLGTMSFDNEVPGSAATHHKGTDSGIGVSLILYAVPQEEENPRVTFVRRDEKYFLVEIRAVQERYVVTAQFEHRDEVSEQQRQVPLTIVLRVARACVIYLADDGTGRLAFENGPAHSSTSTISVRNPF